jgi:UDP-perosamine 4-acetyltransferase
MGSWPSLARLKGLFQRSVGRRKKRDGLLKQLIILGAGGHAKVAIELFREANEFDIMGCLDQTQSGFVGGVPILGDDSLLPSLRKKGVTHAFVAVGDNTIRASLGKKLCDEGFTLANALAGSARISPSARIGTGVALMHGVVINAESVIADFAIINTNATVDHDCHIGLAAHIAPGAVLTGNVKVGSMALIGAGSCILPNVSIGDRALVGAGAVVTKAISADSVSWGVPARQKPAKP